MDFNALGFHRNWRCPQPWEDPTGIKRVGWLKEAVKEGTNYLIGQAAYPLLDRALAIISGTIDEAIPKNLSDVYINLLKRQSRELVATISNLRPLWGFRTDNEMFEDVSGNLTRLNLAWWQGTYAGQKMKEVIQWACISTGYAMPVWRGNYWGPGMGDIDIIPLGPRDVLPVQIPRSHDLQQAYAVIIVEETPVAMMLRQYPYFADKIKIKRNSPSWFGDLGRRVRRAYKGYRHVLEYLHQPGEDSTPSGPTVDKYTIYILDDTINRSGKRMQMGTPGSSWNYTVPFFGELVPTRGMGSPMKEAGRDECLLYPLRRKIVATDDVILQDGSAEYWHGQVPLAPLYLDKWPDQFLGYSMIHDGWSIQKAINRQARALDDYVQKVVGPDVKYDPSGAARKDIEKYDPRVPGQRVPVDSRLGEQFELISMPGMPPGVNPLEFIEWLAKKLDHMLAIPDMKELARAAQIPSDNTLDKIQEIAGPVVEDMSTSMEKPLTMLGEMTKSMFYQFYPDQRKMSILGADGVQQFYKFEKKSIVPSGFKDSARWEKHSIFNLPDNLELARQARNECLLQIVPGSLHQITQMKAKMLRLALWRDGRFPMDPQSLAEVFEISNFGELPGSKPTMLERWKIWMKLFTETQVDTMKQQAVGQAEAQIAAQKTIAQAQIADPLLAMISGLSPGQNGGNGNSPNGSGGEPSPSGNGHGRVGRPPSGEEPPHLEQKKDEAGAPRAVISESK